MLKMAQAIFDVTPSYLDVPINSTVDVLIVVSSCLQATFRPGQPAHESPLPSDDAALSHSALQREEAQDLNL